MVIVRLADGLGNQLFQYATGRALARRLNTTLALDMWEFQRPSLRQYELSHFQITAPLWTDRPPPGVRLGM